MPHDGKLYAVGFIQLRREQVNTPREQNSAVVTCTSVRQGCALAAAIRRTPISQTMISFETPACVPQINLGALCSSRGDAHATRRDRQPKLIRRKDRLPRDHQTIPDVDILRIREAISDIEAGLSSGELSLHSARVAKIPPEHQSQFLPLRPSVIS